MTQAARHLTLSLSALASLMIPNLGCSRAALQEVVATAVTKSSAETVQKMFEQMNASCPKKVDRYTTLQEVVMVDPTRVEVRYVVTDAGKKFISGVDRNQMRDNFVKIMKGKPMAVAIAERDLVMDHIYNDRFGNHVLSYTINRAVLEGIQQASGGERSNPFSGTPTASAANPSVFAESNREPVEPMPQRIGGRYTPRGRTIRTEQGVPAILANPFLDGNHFAKIEKYLKKNPTDHKAALGHGATLVDMEEFERAEKFYKSQLEARPKDAELLYGLGWSYEESKRWADAIEKYEQATNSNKRQVYAWNNWAWVLATCPEDSIRDGERALKLANKAMKLAGGEALFADTLAAALAETGDFETAAELQRRVVIEADEEDKAEFRVRLKSYQQGQAYRSE